MMNPIWGPSLTLQDCLQAFFQADELTGDNMYSCEKCGKSLIIGTEFCLKLFHFSNRLRNGIKYCRMIDLPEVRFHRINEKKKYHEDRRSFSI